jgi:hypothetical protein
MLQQSAQPFEDYVEARAPFWPTHAGHDATF